MEILSEPKRWFDRKKTFEAHVHMERYQGLSRGMLPTNFTSGGRMPEDKLLEIFVLLVVEIFKMKAVPFMFGRRV